LDCGNSKFSAMTMFWGCTGGGTIIANLHVTCERMPIFWPFFVDDNNKWWQSRQQNPTFVSWLIQKKSGKTQLETIPLDINLVGGHHALIREPLAF
jgi:hypothetical protein